MFVEIKTTGEEGAIDITPVINKVFLKLLNYKRKKKGVLFVYNPHTTSALLINEGEDNNLIKDIMNRVDNFIPKHDNYLHDSVDNNAHAHIKASLFNTSLTIPFEDEKLLLGTWQHIFLLEFDGPRTRKIYITLN